MDFQYYNSAAEFQPVGFHNLGHTCYYNVLLQSLLSCTSFTEELLKQDLHSDEPLLKVLAHLIKALQLLDSDMTEEQRVNVHANISKFGPITWKYMIKKLAANSPAFAEFAVGQQCAAEGFSLLMQALEDRHELQNLFLHRRLNRLFCPDCMTWFSEVNEINNTFEVEPATPETEDLNKFLLSQVGSVDEDCRCSKCEVRSKKVKRSELVMIPEVLFVVSKKYKYDGMAAKIDVYTNFPPKLQFNAKNGRVLTYEAVAQIEHAGGINGGHYWAICKRRGGWFCMNDMSMSEAHFKPTNNTYIVLYHII